MHLGGQSIAVAGLVSPQEEISQISGTLYNLIKKCQFETRIKKNWCTVFAKYYPAFIRQRTIVFILLYSCLEREEY